MKIPLSVWVGFYLLNYPNYVLYPTAYCHFHGACAPWCPGPHRKYVIYNYQPLFVQRLISCLLLQNLSSPVWHDELVQTLFHYVSRLLPETYPTSQLKYRELQGHDQGQFWLFLLLYQEREQSNSSSPASLFCISAQFPGFQNVIF